MAEKRLKGQEVSIRISAGGVVLDSIDSIGMFNDNVAYELKEDGFLGETVNRFDEILNGYGGDFEFQITRASWHTLVEQITARATRETPDLEFTVVRTDFYPNGDTAIYTYKDVNFGPLPTAVAGRGEFVRPRLEFRCSDRPVRVNALP